MRQKFRSLLSNPMIVIGLTAVLTALVIQPWELGGIDTLRRLQMTRSLWTSEPPVMADDVGLIGRNGNLQYWHGMGQSLAMLPADIVAQGVVRLISHFREPPWWLVSEEIMVSYITSTLLCTLAVLGCFRFLRLLAFSVNQSIAGALTLLFGTTFLHYTQNMQENNLLLLLTLTGFYFQYDWLKNGSNSSLLWGSMALGANLLIRLSSGLDWIAVFLFVVLCLWYETESSEGMGSRLIGYGRICIPCYAVFIAIERLYNYYRFGSLSNTSQQIFVAQFQRMYPGLTMEPGWPWSTPFWRGFLGPLITPEKSIFLFDPLIVLTLILTLLLWKHFGPETKAYVVALVWLLLSYIVLYAKYYNWSGNPAWGDRFVTVPLQLLAMISIPLLMRYRAALKPWLWKLGKAIAATSVVVQIASVFFWYRLELQQMGTFGHPTFVVGLRFLNIIAFAAGMTDRWGLNNQYTVNTLLDPWHRSSTAYFFPFLAMHKGTSGLKAAFLIAGWICLLTMLLSLLLSIKAKLRRREECQ
jgi:hypothetical protein